MLTRSVIGSTMMLWNRSEWKKHMWEWEMRRLLTVNSVIRNKK